MKPSLLLFTSLIILFASCKKDKLEGDKDILIGEWEWTYSNYYFEQCNPPSILQILTPESENVNYTIKFYEKGKVDFITNGNIVETYRIIFAKFRGGVIHKMDTHILGSI
ncbi:hypothetical protein JYT72_00040 [Crocinitomix catalasitica]|nr:hypothetical protein [Crocinitomix catalasitica]